jgi:hypothetical protein
MIKEQAEATEELTTALTKNHTRQIETLIKSTNKAMKEMMSLIKNKQKAPNSQPIMEERKGKRKGKRGITTHLSANYAEGNIPPNQKSNAGSWTRTKTPTHQTGNQRRAHEGAQGP